MKHPSAGLVLLLLLALTVGVGTAARSSKLTGVPNRQELQQSKVRDSIKQKVGKPTPVEDGVMTDRQRAHSKLFKRFEVTTGGKKIRELIPDNGEIYLVQSAPDDMVTSSFDLNTYLTNETCTANAVLIGIVGNKFSNLIDEGTFIFTDYEIKIIEVLKDNTVLPLQTNQTVTYTSPGGAIELSGKVINAIDYRREPLVVGKQYLLYGTFIRDTQSYKGLSNARGGDTFEFKDGLIIQASKMALPLGTRRSMDANQFMTSVRMATHQTCPK